MMDVGITNKSIDSGLFENDIDTIQQPNVLGCEQSNDSQSGKNVVSLINIEDLISNPSNEIPSSDSSECSTMEEEETLLSPVEPDSRTEENPVISDVPVQNKKKQSKYGHSMHDYHGLSNLTSRKKRNRIPFLLEEKKYILDRYSVLIRSTRLRVNKIAVIIYEELYVNTEDITDQLILSIREQLSSSISSGKKQRSKKSILNLLYNTRKQSKN